MANFNPNQNQGNPSDKSNMDQQNKSTVGQPSDKSKDWSRQQQQGQQQQKQKQDENNRSSQKK